MSSSGVFFKKNGIIQLNDTKSSAALSTNVLDGIDKSLFAPPVDAKKTRKKQEKKDAADSAGAGWFNLKAPKLTEELKQDLKALALRNFVDPKRFYKKDKSLGKIPKFFQIGTVIEGPTEFYSSRINKRDRKKNMVEEILQTHQPYIKSTAIKVQQSRPQRNRKMQQQKKRGKK